MGQLNNDGQFEIQLIVTAADIDELNHVSNVVYVRWVQEVAVAHWQALASEEAQRKVVWVVLRHEIDYKTGRCRRRRDRPNVGGKSYRYYV